MLYSLVFLLAMIGLIMLLTAWTVENDLAAIITSLLGAFAWGLTAYGLFNIEKTTSCCRVTYSEPALALFAVGALIVTILPAFVDPFDMIRDADENADPFEKI